MFGSTASAVGEYCGATIAAVLPTTATLTQEGADDGGTSSVLPECSAPTARPMDVVSDWAAAPIGAASAAQVRTTYIRCILDWLLLFRARILCVFNAIKSIYYKVNLRNNLRSGSVARRTGRLATEGYHQITQQVCSRACRRNGPKGMVGKQAGGVGRMWPAVRWLCCRGIRPLAAAPMRYVILAGSGRVAISPVAGPFRTRTGSTGSGLTACRRCEMSIAAWPRMRASQCEKRDSGCVFRVALGSRTSRRRFCLTLEK